MGAISGLSTGGNSQATDLFLISRSGTSYKVTLTQLTAIETAARIAADAVNAAAIAAEITNRGNQYTAINGTLSSLSAVALDKTGDTMSGNLAMGTNAITGLADPTNAQDAATKNYVVTRKVTDLTAPTGSFSMNSQKITNLLDPSSAQDAATKNYVDGLVGTADETTEGILEVATNAEVTAGALDTKTVTPLKLYTYLPFRRGSGTTSAVMQDANSSASGNLSLSIGTATVASGAVSLAGGSGDAAQFLTASGFASFNFSDNDGSVTPGSAAAADRCAILAGLNQNISTGANDSAILGGQTNSATAASVVILGGQSRTVSQAYTTSVETLRVQQGIQKRVTGISSNTTLTYQHSIITVDTSGGAVTVTLPASPVTGQEYEIIRTVGAVNALTVDGNGNNINGAATSTISTTLYSKERLIYSGTAWFKLNT